MDNKNYEQIADYWYSGLENGEFTPTKLVAYFSHIKKAMDLISSDDNFIADIRQELETQGDDGKLTRGNMRVELAEVGTKYDFSQCGDTVLTDLYSERLILDSAIKTREQFLKNITQKMEIVTEDGELITVYPAIRSSKSKYKVIEIK